MREGLVVKVSSSQTIEVAYQMLIKVLLYLGMFSNKGFDDDFKWTIYSNLVSRYFKNVVQIISEIFNH